MLSRGALDKAKIKVGLSTEVAPHGTLQIVSKKQCKPSVFFFSFAFFASGHGRPHRQSWMSALKSMFSCGMGRNKLLTPARPCIRVGNVRGKSGPKSLCFLLCDSLDAQPFREFQVRCASMPVRVEQKISCCLLQSCL